jgi:CDP-diacylglycerol--serine O-phosphatidyltransferase
VSTYPHPVIAREGWPFIAIAVVATLVLYWVGGVIGLVVGVLATAFVVQFFRDPPRNVPDAPNAVLSPADGRVVSVGVARDPWLERDALRISVFMNVFNVHSNRSPVDGEVREVWYNAGAFVNAALDKASTENERNALHLRTKDGRDVTCVQVAGPHRATHPVLREEGRRARARPALRLHPLRLARRRLPAEGRAPARRGRRHRLRDRVDPRRVPLEGTPAMVDFDKQRAIAKNRVRRRGIYILPNLFTTAALFAGFYAIVQAMNQRFDMAAIAIFIAAVLDSLDGRVARLTRTQSAFGAEFDSLADMVSFGAAPALVIYEWSLKGLGKLGWIAAFVYVAGAALRLARFNTQLEVADKRWFQGLPSPSAGALVAGFVFIMDDYAVAPSAVQWWAWSITLAAGLAMVSNLKYYSFKAINLKRSVPFVAILLFVVFIALCRTSRPSCCSADSWPTSSPGFVMSGWSLLRRRRAPPAVPLARAGPPLAAVRNSGTFPRTMSSTFTARAAATDRSPIESAIALLGLLLLRLARR